MLKLEAWVIWALSRSAKTPISDRCASMWFMASRSASARAYVRGTFSRWRRAGMNITPFSVSAKSSRLAVLRVSAAPMALATPECCGTTVNSSKRWRTASCMALAGPPMTYTRPGATRRPSSSSWMVYTGLSLISAKSSWVEAWMAAAAAATACAASISGWMECRAANSATPRREASTLPWAQAPVQFKASMSVGRAFTGRPAPAGMESAKDGPRRVGPTRTASPSTLMAESPPMPMERTLSARTRVGWLPMWMPSFSTSGWPSTNTAMSVVVPPMSRMIESRVMSHRAMMPMTLAAGPEKMLCTGMRRA